MSIYNLDAKADKTIDHEYRGIKFYVKAVPDMKGFQKALTENVTKFKGAEDELDQETAERCAGMAMVDTMVVGFDSFEIESDEGKQTIEWDGVIEHEFYTTQGEALISDSPVLQDYLYQYCMRLSRTPPDYEVKALGKS